jgi:membrane protein involved in colicin uptake
MRFRKVEMKQNPDGSTSVITKNPLEDLLNGGGTGGGVSQEYVEQQMMAMDQNIQRMQGFIGDARTVADTAKSVADTAKTDAATAKSTATAAQTTANTAKSTADTAQSTATTAKSTADTAKTTADKGVADAAAAKTTADKGVTDAAAAKSSATTVDGKVTALDTRVKALEAK